MDRIDLHVFVPEVKVEKLVLVKTQNLESSASVRERVQKARIVQEKRFAGTTFHTNAEMHTKAVKDYCPLPDVVLSFLRRAVSQMHLSARGYYKVIKVSRTIADLSQEKNITISHVAEALQYRHEMPQ